MGLTHKEKILRTMEELNKLLGYKYDSIKQLLIGSKTDKF